MSKIKRRPVKKFLSATALATSFYISAVFGIGLILGYLGTKYFYKKFIANRRIKTVLINVGGWKIHLHHWIIGALILVVVGVINSIHISRFSAGIICGLIAHDIYDFNDWHKVIARKQKPIAT